MSVTVSVRKLGSISEELIIQQCCPRRTLSENGSSAVLAPSGKVSGAYARQDSVNQTTFGTCFHICNPVNKSHVARVPPLAGGTCAPCFQLASSIPHARRCPDCARARSDMIPVLVFSHLATTYLDMERKRLYDPVMPFHAPPHFFHLDTNVYSRHTAHVVPRYYTGSAPRFIGLSRILEEVWDCDYCGVYILLT